MNRIRNFFSKNKFSLFLAIVPGNCFFSTSSLLFRVNSKTMLSHCSVSRLSDHTFDSIPHQFVINLTSSDWSDEELSYAFEQFARVRNHRILSLERTTKKKSVVHIHCNKCDTDFQCMGWNYLRNVNKDNFSYVLEHEKNDPRPKPNVWSRCKSIYVSKFNNAKKGKDHPMYVHGLSSTEQKRPDYDRSAYKEWKFQVHRRYKGVCFLTGSRDDVVCHHLESWSSCKEKRYVPSNGVLIKRKIHEHFHSVAGLKTTAKQFEDYCKEYFNVHVFPWNSTDCRNALPIDMDEVREKSNLFQQEMLDLIQKRGYVHKEGEYENKQSIFTLECPKHGTPHQVKAYKFKKAKYGMPCCAHRSPLVRPPSQKGLVRHPITFELKRQTYAKKYMPVLEELAKTSDHEILQGTYETKKSEFLIRCAIHETTQSISYFKYCRSVYGLECCRLENKRR